MNKEFQIIDSYQQKMILSEIYQKYELKLDYASFESSLKRISEFKRNNDYVLKMCQSEPGQIMEKSKVRETRLLKTFYKNKKLHILWTLRI